MTSARTNRPSQPSPSRCQQPFNRMTAAEMTAESANAAMTTAVRARVLAGQKDDQAPVAHRPVAVPKVAAPAVDRPAARRCVARAGMMTTGMTTTVRLGRAVPSSVGPEWVRAALAECPASAARRSSAAAEVDSAADRRVSGAKVPDVCLASAARRRSAGCPACLALVALPAAGPALAAGRTMSMTALPL